VTVEALVTRKIRDLTRDSAADLLRAAGVEFERIERAELWSFEMSGEGARCGIEKILRETTLVVNPNVHRYSVKAWETSPADGCRVFVRVRDRVDPRGAQVARSIRQRFGAGGPSRVERSVLWSIDLASTDAAGAERLGRELAGLGPRGAGLLANSHSQDVEVSVRAA
jgi:hypothetical protein